MAPLGRTRFRLSLALIGALSISIASPLPALAAEDAKAELARGARAERAKDWTAALGAYEAAQAAEPSAAALEGVANARFSLGHHGEAYEAYASWLAAYGSKAPTAKRSAVTARLKELEGKTGLLSIVGSVVGGTGTDAHAGAKVTVDDRPAGTLPLAKPLRLSEGPHRVRVDKAGFLPFDQVPNVPAGGAATVSVALEAPSTKARLTVRERSGATLRVQLDGVDVGETPYSAEIASGPHTVSGRSPTLAAPSERVEVLPGQTREVELVATQTTAALKVTTSDGKGNVYLDGKLVGEGSFFAEVPSGPHTIRVTREGFDAYETDVVLKEKEPRSVAVTLKLSSKIETVAVENEARRLEGLYGGFGLHYLAMPNGSGSSVQRTCESGARPATILGCSGEGQNPGGALTGFIGYHWDPVGVELYAGGQYDQTKPEVSWGPSTIDPGIQPDPARTESFTLRRLGAFGIARVRLTVQGKKVRFTAATGVGLSYRSMLLERRTRATADPRIEDAFIPDASSYLAPVLSFEPSLHYRISDGISVGAGLSVLLESPNVFDGIPMTASDGGRTLGPSGLTTPPYELARNTQFFIGPFVGMMFGP